MSRKNVLLCFSGSVATIKAPLLLEELRKQHEVQVIFTNAAAHFCDAEALFDKSVVVHRDAGEWTTWQKVGDAVLHIDLRKWADIIVIAPLSANTLAKISNGLCDNLLTCVVRAWDFSQPMLLAPAMNTLMWSHPFTAKQLETMTALGATVIPPVSKTLACGDVGVGAMASVESIVAAVASAAT